MVTKAPETPFKLVLWVEEFFPLSSVSLCNKDATSNKGIASSNKCLTSSNKKLLVTSASLLVTSALLIVTRTRLVTRASLIGAIGRY